MLKKCPEFDEIISNFKKVSRGGEDNQPMINSKAPVYNFDRIAKRYAKKYKLDTPSTSDGLYIDDITNKFYLIEFKSGTIEPENVFCKVYDSAVILRDTIFTKSYDEIRKNVEYIFQKFVLVDLNQKTEINWQIKLENYQKAKKLYLKSNMQKIWYMQMFIH